MADYFRPGMLAHTYLGVFTDFVDYLSLWSGGSSQTTSQTMIRQAVITAYRAVPLEREWKYLTTNGRIQTEPPYSTGTLAYTQSTLTVTLTGGTWPSWAANGVLVINQQVHDVNQVLSPTTLLLSPEMNPGANLSAGTSYTLYQDVYDLPYDFRSLRQVITANNFNLAYLPVQDLIWRQRRLRNSGQPQFYSIFPNPNAYGVNSLALYPFPDANYMVDVPYQRFPRGILHTGYAASEYSGTIQNTGSAVTGIGTSFTANMVGSVLRFGTASDYPTSQSTQTAYQEQQIISAVTDATHLTLAATPSQNYAPVKFRISDPIDLPEFMYMAFLRRCELETVRMLRQERTGGDAALANYRMALEQACEGDNQVLGTRELSSPSYYQWWNLGPAYGQQG